MIRRRKINRKRITVKKSIRIGQYQIEFEKIWLIIPFLFYAVGFFIHNVYLTDYYTFDFEIIQTKYIYIGFLFSFYTSFLCLFLILTEKKSDLKIGPFLDFAAWLIRLSLIVVIIHAILFPFDVRLNNILDIIYGSSSLTILFIFTGLTFLVYFVWLFLNHLIISSIIINTAKIFFAVSLIPVFYIFFVYYQHDKQFSIVIDFITAPFSISFIVILFGLNITESKFIKNKNLINTLFSLLLVLLFFFFAVDYSKKIYPLIPSNFGGGKPVNAMILTDSDTIKCQILNENSEWLLLKREGMNKYERIRINSVKRLVLIKEFMYKPAEPKELKKEK